MAACPGKYPYQVALGRPGEKRVSLWARVKENYPDGGFRFYVINGDWLGRYDPKRGEVTCEGGQWCHPNDTYFDADLLWSGVAPFSDDQYNEAIGWLNERINRPIWAKITDALKAVWELRHYRLQIKWVRQPTTRPKPPHVVHDDYDADDDIPF